MTLTETKALLAAEAAKSKMDEADADEAYAREAHVRLCDSFNMDFDGDPDVEHEMLEESDDEVWDAINGARQARQAYAAACDDARAAQTAEAMFHLVERCCEAASAYEAAFRRLVRARGPDAIDAARAGLRAAAVDGRDAYAALDAAEAEAGVGA